MDESLALEVFGGPMDGLRVDLNSRSTVKIGRQVGNHLTLPFDMTISRWHATIGKEGNAYYLIDENSGAGTWVEGARIEKIKIEPGMILLLGGTILGVGNQPPGAGDRAFEDSFFNDPSTVYHFSDTLKSVWLSLKDKKSYCGVSGVFQQPELHSQKELYRYNGIKQICSGPSQRLMPGRVKDSPIQPSYRFFSKGQFVTSPRMWTILDMASSGNTKTIDLYGFVEAVLKEGKSPAARMLKKDKAFVAYFKNRWDLPGKQYPHPAGDPNPNELLKDELPKEALLKKDPLKEVLAGTLVHLEAIVSGFMEDAFSSGLSKGEAIPTPGNIPLEKQLDAQGMTQLAHRLKRLENNIVALLAAHRDAIHLFEKELGARIHRVLDDGEAKLFHSDAGVSQAVRRVLKEAELEDLAGRLVRQTIQNKLKR